MPKFFRIISVVSLLVAGVTACSMAGFGYDIAPRLAVRYVDDYLQLSNRQEARALQLFEARKEIHQRDELPQYAIFMVDVERRLEQGPTSEDIDHVLERVSKFWSFAIERTVPAITTILLDLDEDQVDALGKKLADSEERYRERIEEHDPEKELEERIEGIEEWTGELNEAQRQLVQQRLATLNDTRVAWLKWRIERNSRLMTLLREQADTQALEEFLLKSWVSREYVDPELVEATEENRKRYVDLLLELNTMITPEQRERVERRLAEYREIVWDLLEDEQRLALEEQLEQGTLLDGDTFDTMGTQ
jgi:hypothetical protein